MGFLGSSVAHKEKMKLLDDLRCSEFPLVLWPITGWQEQTKIFHILFDIIPLASASGLEKPVLLISKSYLLEQVHPENNP